MGTSPSKASPLAPTFERMATWDLKASRRLLQTYKDEDMDFGLDSQGLADLIGGDKNWAEGIIDAFRSRTGIINALAFVCGACLVSSGPALEKAGMIFDALDFDATEQISMDEMTISLLCSARGFCVMAGVGTVPSDEELESVTLQAYHDLNKGSTQSITKAEFTKWLLEFAGGTGAPPTREVTLQSALEQFRVVAPAENIEEKEENNIIAPQGGDDEPVAASVVYADNVEVDERPKQEANEKALLIVPDEEKDLELPKQIEPEFVATDSDEYTPNEFPGDTRQTIMDVVPADNTLFDSGDNGEEHSRPDDLDDRITEDNEDESLENEPEQKIANESHGFEIDHMVAADAESDSLMVVAEVDVPPLANDTSGHSPLTDEQSNELRAEESLEKEITDVEIQQGNTNNSNNFETEDIASVFASEKLEKKESPPEPIELETYDLEYEQDDFAQGTPRTDDVADHSLPGENADIHPLENKEGTTNFVHAQIEITDEVGEPAVDANEHEVTSNREGAEKEINVDEISTPFTTLDDEPTASTATSENAKADDEVTTATGPEGASSQTESQELQEDSMAVADSNGLSGDKTSTS